MGNFQKLFFWFFVISICFLTMTSLSHAAVESVPPNTGTGWTYSPYGVAAGALSTPLLACQNANNFLDGSFINPFIVPIEPAWTSGLSGSIVASCKGTYVATGQTGHVRYISRYSVSPVCPLASPPYIYNIHTSMCERTLSDCPAAGTLFSSGMWDIGTNPDALDPALLNGCAAGCGTTIAQMDSISARGKEGGIYHYYATGVLVHTGISCVAGPTNSPSSADPTAPQTCGPNQVAILSTSGVLNCYNDMTGDAQAGTTTTPSTTTSNSTATTTDSTGATSTTTTTTTTTTNNTTTAPAADAAVPPELQKYCTDNPTAVICKDPNEPQFTAPPAGSPDVSQSWYQKVYPSGISGVLSAGISDMRATPLGSAIAGFGLSVNAAASTGCFSFSGVVGSFANLGLIQFCIPSYVLNFIGIFFMLMAVIAARGIIFGG